ncbi:MAG TPA: hypothetical protein DCP28_24360, partial [Cytophagales bacterium]|nr:hypothetical protein [Cytophagales bacterium]
MRHLIPLLAVCMLFGCERIRQQDRVLPPLDSLNALAITDLRDRLADRPSDTEAWYGLALSLAMEEDSADALYALTQAMSQELDSVYLPLRAHLHGWAGQTTEALSYAEAYWATHSPNWDLRVAMGKWTAELGAPRTGLLYVNEALNKLPGYGPYLLAKANLFLYHLGDSVQGERWLRLAANT